jgi:hypothetical protein
LPKMSAGITNPCAYIDQPARALALGTDRPAHASQRNNHYGCPTIRKAGPPRVCRRLGMPRPELDIDLNAGDPSHQGWAPGLGLRTQGWMVDGSGPVKKYRWDLCIPTVAV